MARMIPSVFDPNCTSPGEKEIFNRLKNDPATSDWTVLHTLDLANHVSQISGEIDFVIIIPEKGVLCLEVKSHRRISRAEDGLWYFGSSIKPDARGPFKQVATAMHSLRAQLVEKRPYLSRVPFWAAVAFPYTQFNYASPEWHPWQVIDSMAFWSRSLGSTLLEVMEEARRHLAKAATANWFHIHSKEPYPQQCTEIAEALRPSFECFVDNRVDMQVKEQELKHYTEEQFQALDAMDLNERVVFSGPAGTGKTFLALEACRRASKKGLRTLLLCYNRFLAVLLRKQVENLPNIDVATIHQYMLALVGEKDVLDERDAGYWEVQLPDEAISHMLDHDNLIGRYDEAIVDEAQDILRDTYLDVIDLSLKGGLGSGRWRLFGDFDRQAIYEGADRSLAQFRKRRASDFAQYSLRVNCRNTPRVAALAEAMGGVVPSYSSVRRTDDGVDPEIRYYAEPQHQICVLEEVLTDLHRQGYQNEEIIILSSTSQSPAASYICNEPSRTKLAKYDPFGDLGGKIGYCTIQAFKGLESPVVIITDIRNVTEAYSQSLLYIGITRALHKLVILLPGHQKPSVVDTVVKNIKAKEGYRV